MKRFFYFVGTIALLASCSNSFEIERDDLPSRGGVEIKFKSYASAMTKAIDPRVPGTNIFGNNDTFLLWGLQYDKDSTLVLSPSSDYSIPCNLYQRTPVLAKRNGTSLDWTPIIDTVSLVPVKRYWNKNSKYIFAALSSATESLYCGMQFKFATTSTLSYVHKRFFDTPSAVCFAPDESAINHDAENKGITAIFNGHNNDLLVADAVFVNKVPESPGQVTLNFHHMASMIDVLIKKDEEITDSVVVKKIQIDKLRYVGIPGVFWDDVTQELSQEGTVSASPDTIFWCHFLSDQQLSNNKYTSMDGSNGVSNKTIPEGGVGITSEADTLIGQLIVMPQPIEEDMTATIEYRIDHSGDYSITVPIANFNTSWEPGRHYTYTFIISANKISLEPIIETWATNN